MEPRAYHFGQPHLEQGSPLTLDWVMPQSHGACSKPSLILRTLPPRVLLIPQNITATCLNLIFLVFFIYFIFQTSNTYRHTLTKRHIYSSSHIHLIIHTARSSAQTMLSFAGHPPCAGRPDTIYTRKRERRIHSASPQRICSLLWEIQYSGPHINIYTTTRTHFRWCSSQNKPRTAIYQEIRKRSWVWRRDYEEE